ncbi:DUF6907 domain-containing protein [Streptacidiphilus cavernicola]|uniref:SMI1/KNR4 family protein n=1 Tax=Streptacidiphilus cavernicola TaxID=3342716 RepID=A0ABV6VRP0_9ACTN
MDFDETDEELLDGWPEPLPAALDVLGPCPPWCAGRPHLENTSEYACDQAHESERLKFQAELASGQVAISGDAQIVWVPFSELPGGDVPYVGLRWDEGFDRLGPGDVLAVADGIEAWAGQLRVIAERLRGIRAGELPDQGTSSPRVDPP